MILQMNPAIQKTEQEALREEVKFLKKKLRLRVDLVSGEINLAMIEDKMPKQDLADIQFLTKMQQWPAFRRWIVLNAKLLYEQAAGSGPSEGYIMCRLAKCIIDMLQEAERLQPEESQAMRDDGYDETHPMAQPTLPADNLPLGEAH